MGKGADWGPTKENGFSARKQILDVQREGGGKFRLLISTLPSNLKILGSPHDFVRSGMGLPTSD